MRRDVCPIICLAVVSAILRSQVNPQIVVLQASARTGEGLDAWYGWLRTECRVARAAALI